MTNIYNLKLTLITKYSKTRLFTNFAFRKSALCRLSQSSFEGRLRKKKQFRNVGVYVCYVLPEESRRKLGREHYLKLFINVVVCFRAISVSGLSQCNLMLANNVIMKCSEQNRWFLLTKQAYFNGHLIQNWDGCLKDVQIKGK